jgi:hypothetical protein
VAIEVTASIAASEPDPYLAQVYRFGLLEDFDHMYRYSGLMDRVKARRQHVLAKLYGHPAGPTDVGRASASQRRPPDPF